MRGDRRFPVIEIFGPVIQGEGALIGVPTYFIRLGGCDYKCSWCDTMYAVDPKQIVANKTSMTDSEIVDALNTLSDHREGGVQTVTWSGGNPCIHDLQDAVEMLAGHGWYQVCETQGTQIQLWTRWMSYLVVSPKPPSSGMTTDWERLSAFLDFNSNVNTSIKVVLFNDDDFEFLCKVVERYPQHPVFAQAGSPVGKSLDLTTEIIRETYLRMSSRVLADPLTADVRLLPQLHTLMHGSVRGV